MKLRKILLWVTGAAAGYLLSGCGPSMEELEQRARAAKDSIASYNAAIVTGNVTANPNDPNNTPAHTYSAMDFGLPSGIVVRWVPRSIADDITSDENFPEVYIHIKGSDGVVKISRVNWNIWQNLVTGDTLK